MKNWTEQYDWQSKTYQDNEMRRIHKEPLYREKITFNERIRDIVKLFTELLSFSR